MPATTSGVPQSVLVPAQDPSGKAFPLVFPPNSTSLQRNAPSPHADPWSPAPSPLRHLVSTQQPTELKSWVVGCRAATHLRKPSAEPPPPARLENGARFTSIEALRKEPLHTEAAVKPRPPSNVPPLIATNGCLPPIRKAIGRSVGIERGVAVSMRAVMPPPSPVPRSPYCQVVPPANVRDRTSPKLAPALPHPAASLDPWSHFDSIADGNSRRPNFVPFPHCLPPDRSFSHGCYPIVSPLQPLPASSTKCSELSSLTSAEGSLSASKDQGWLPYQLMAALDISVPAVLGEGRVEGLPFVFQFVSLLKRSSEPAGGTTTRLAQELAMVLCRKKGGVYTQAVSPAVQVRRSYIVYETIALGLLAQQGEAGQNAALARAVTCSGTFLNPIVVRQWPLYTDTNPDVALDTLADFLGQNRTLLVCRLLKAVGGGDQYLGHLPHITKVIELMVTLASEPCTASLGYFLVASKVFSQLFGALCKEEPSISELLLVLLCACPAFLSQRSLDVLERQTFPRPGKPFLALSANAGPEAEDDGMSTSSRAVFSNASVSDSEVAFFYEDIESDLDTSKDSRTDTSRAGLGFFAYLSANVHYELMRLASKSFMRSPPKSKRPLCRLLKQLRQRQLVRPASLNVKRRRASIPATLLQSISASSYRMAPKVVLETRPPCRRKMRRDCPVASAGPRVSTVYTALPPQEVLAMTTQSPQRHTHPCLVCGLVADPTKIRGHVFSQQCLICPKLRPNIKPTPSPTSASPLRDEALEHIFSSRQHQEVADAKPEHKNGKLGADRSYEPSDDPKVAPASSLFGSGWHGRPPSGEETREAIPLPDRDGWHDEKEDERDEFKDCNETFAQEGDMPKTYEMGDGSGEKREDAPTHETVCASSVLCENAEETQHKTRRKTGFGETETPQKHSTLFEETGSEMHCVNINELSTLSDGLETISSLAPPRRTEKELDMNLLIRMLDEIDLPTFRETFSAYQSQQSPAANGQLEQRYEDFRLLGGESAIKILVIKDGPKVSDSVEVSQHPLEMQSDAKKETGDAQEETGDVDESRDGDRVKEEERDRPQFGDGDERAPGSESDAAVRVLCPYLPGEYGFVILDYVDESRDGDRVKEEERDWFQFGDGYEKAPGPESDAADRVLCPYLPGAYGFVILDYGAPTGGLEEVATDKRAAVSKRKEVAPMSVTSSEPRVRNRLSNGTASNSSALSSDDDCFTEIPEPHETSNEATKPVRTHLSSHQTELSGDGADDGREHTPLGNRLSLSSDETAEVSDETTPSSDELSDETHELDDAPVDRSSETLDNSKKSEETASTTDMPEETTSDTDNFDETLSKSEETEGTSSTRETASELSAKTENAEDLQSETLHWSDETATRSDETTMSAHDGSSTDGQAVESHETIDSSSPRSGDETGASSEESTEGRLQLLVAEETADETREKVSYLVVETGDLLSRTRRRERATAAGPESEHPSVEQSCDLLGRLMPPEETVDGYPRRIILAPPEEPVIEVVGAQVRVWPLDDELFANGLVIEVPDEEIDQQGKLEGTGIVMEVPDWKAEEETPEDETAASEDKVADLSVASEDFEGASQDEEESAFTSMADTSDVLVDDEDLYTSSSEEWEATTRSGVKMAKQRQRRRNLPPRLCARVQRRVDALSVADSKLVEMLSFLKRLFEGSIAAVLSLKAAAMTNVDNTSGLRQPQSRFLQRLLLGSNLLLVLAEALPPLSVVSSCRLRRHGKVVNHAQPTRRKLPAKADLRSEWKVPLHVTLVSLEVIEVVSSNINKTPSPFVGYSWRLHGLLSRIVAPLQLLIEAVSVRLLSSREAKRRRPGVVLWFDKSYQRKYLVQKLLNLCLAIIVDTTTDSTAKTFDLIRPPFWRTLTLLLTHPHAPDSAKVKSSTILKQLLRFAPREPLLKAVVSSDLLARLVMYTWYLRSERASLVERDRSLGPLIDFGGYLAETIAEHEKARMNRSADGVMEELKQVLNMNSYWNEIIHFLLSNINTRLLHPVDVVPLEHTKRLRDFRKLEEKSARQKKAGFLFGEQGFEIGLENRSTWTEDFLIPSPPHQLVAPSPQPCAWTPAPSPLMPRLTPSPLKPATTDVRRHPVNSVRHCVATLLSRPANPASGGPANSPSLATSLLHAALRTANQPAPLEYPQ